MIRVNLQNLYNQQATHFSNVLKQLTNFQTVIDADISNLGAKLKTIVEQSTKINTQFRDFVNGHTVDDIITAIGNISVSVGDVTVDSYDDTKLLATLGRIETQLGQVITGLSSVETAIKNIPFTDNTGILAALGRIETKLGDLNITGGSTDLTPVTSAIAALNENISKISTHAADKLFAVSVLPDTDGLSYVNGEFTYSVVEGTPFYTVSDPVDFEFLSDSSSALTTDHIYLPDPAETDTLMFVIDSSLAGLGLGDTLHNYLNNLFFSVYSGSGAEFMVSGSDFTPTTDGKFVYYLEFDGSDYFWLEVHDGGWLPGCFFAYPAQRIGESSSSGYDIYTCSRCGDTYQDHSGTGAPEDYSDTSISKLVVRLFSRLGTFAGKLIAFIIGLFDKALSSVDRVITRFNELTDQITGFGGDYPTWLSGFWGVLPQELQLALTFAVVCMAIGVVGRKLVFS